MTDDKILNLYEKVAHYPSIRGKDNYLFEIEGVLHIEAWYHEASRSLLVSIGDCLHGLNTGSLERPESIKRADVERFIRVEVWDRNNAILKAARIAERQKRKAIKLARDFYAYALANHSRETAKQTA